jgi:maltooligosyltrehalose trehalohydrolase
VTFFRVWAPSAQRIELVTAGERLEMQPAERGYWTVDVPAARGEFDYAFSMDGQEPLPDPRSPSQPDGVHGRSRWVGHGQFAWTDAGWQAPPLGSAIIYEMHVGTFTPAGTFDTAIERLEHLVDLGVTHVELMPVAETPGSRGWGYDGVDLYAPHHGYGGPDGLKRLVNACHEHGLGVILDVVYNHLGPDGNYLGRFGPYFTDHYTTPWGQAVNMDGEDSDDVRRFFIDNALMWLRDYHFDGLRLDAVHAIVDTSAIHFLEQLAAGVADLEKHLGRYLFLIAESDRNDPRLLWSRERGGYGLSAQWSDDFHHALHALLTGEHEGYYVDFGSFEHVARALRRAYVFDGRYSEFRRRHHGRPAEGLAGDRFIGFMQNHDQVGNRAQGERSSHLMSPGRLKVAAALLMTSPFVPMLFQGEEWAASTPFQYFTDHQDPALGKAVTTGRRAEFAAFGWDTNAIPDPQAVETFERSRLDWSEIARQPHADILEWHKQLIALRRRYACLMDGNLGAVEVGVSECDRSLVIKRDEIIVAVNLAEARRDVAVPCERVLELLVSSDPKCSLDAGAASLEADSVAILRETF